MLSFVLLYAAVVLFATAFACLLAEVPFTWAEVRDRNDDWFEALLAREETLSEAYILAGRTRAGWALWYGSQTGSPTLRSDFMWAKFRIMTRLVRVQMRLSMAIYTQTMKRVGFDPEYVVESHTASAFSRFVAR